MSDKDKRNCAVKKTDSEQAEAKKKSTRVVLILVSVVLCVFVVIGFTLWAVFKHYYNMTRFIDDNEVSLADDMSDTEKEEDTLSVDLSLEFEDIESKRAQVDIDIPGGGYVYNILLIGLDLRRGENWNGNSDSMILVSINKETKEIIMTSFMRDLYAVVPGVAVPKKLNYAHALGAGPLLVQTIEDMYKLDIDNYATVNFYDMIDIIDSIGGIELDVTEEEANVANVHYVPYLARETGVDAAAHQLSAGHVHLDGLQAVAFSRIRYTAGSDYARTERQRRVLSTIFDKLKTLSLTEVNTFVNAALPCITHNIDEATLASLLTSVPGLLEYRLETNRVPYDNHYGVWNEMLVPDFEYTINTLHETIYKTN